MALQTVTDSNSGDFSVEGTPDEAPAPPQETTPAVEPPQEAAEAAPAGEEAVESPQGRDDRGRWAKTPQEAAEETAQTLADEDAAAAAPVEPKPTRRDPQFRIDKAVRAQREAERRADEYAQQLRTLQQQWEQAQAPRPPVQGDTFPAYDTWSDANPGKPYETYIDARAEFVAERRIQAYQRETAAQQRAREAETQTATLRDRGKQVYPDWDDVFTGLDLKVPQPVYHAMLTDPDGHRLAYELATHPDLVSQMSQMDPLQIGVALGMLKARHATAPPGPARGSTAPTAPPPIKPVGSSPAQVTPAAGSEDEDFDVFARRENALAAKRRREHLR